MEQTLSELHPNPGWGAPEIHATDMVGSQVSCSENLGLLLPSAAKALEVGGAHQALMRFAHGLKQKLLPGWIQFGEHIIKKQQWRLPTELGHQFQFSEL